MKKNGVVYMCSDFKVTSNPALHIVQYLLPRIEDVFASFTGGEPFSSLQMETGDSDKE